jgi:hypothetical protein
MSKTKLSRKLKEIEEEIEGYKVRKPIADAMRRCGELGFEFSGHGCGFGGEDFNLINKKKNMYVNFCDRGRTCEVSVYTCNHKDDESEHLLCEGTIGKAMKFVESKS